MGAFLDDQTTTVLQATLAGDVVTCANSVSSTRLPPRRWCSPNCDRVRCARAISRTRCRCPPWRTRRQRLDHQLRQVYGPLLGNGARRWRRPGGRQARGLVAELEAGLGNVLRLTGGVGDLTRVDPADSLLVGIAPPLDEFTLWSEVAYAKDVSEPTRRPRTRCTARSNPSRNGSSD